MTYKIFKDDDIEGALDFMRKPLAKGSSSYNFDLLMETDEGLKVFSRKNQPCYGELRTYSPGEHRPEDLRSPFPDGKPLALSVPTLFKVAREREFFVKRSPFRNVLGMSEDHKSGFLFTDLSMEPTYLVSALKMFKTHAHGFTAFKKALTKDYGLSEEEMFFLSLYMQAGTLPLPGTTDRLPAFFQKCPSYVLSPKANSYRFLNALPTDLTGGSLGDRTPYDRERLHEVFGATSQKMLLRDCFNATFRGLEAEVLPRVIERMRAHLLVSKEEYLTEQKGSTNEK